MEDRILRLVAQVGLLALGVWVLASAVGKGSQATITKPKQARKLDPKSQVWNQSPVVGPDASAGLLFSPGVII